MLDQLDMRNRLGNLLAKGGVKPLLSPGMLPGRESGGIPALA